MNSSNQISNAVFLPNETVSSTVIELEIAILGGILMDPHAMERVIEVLQPQNFTLKRHQTIYRTCCVLASTRQPIDLMTVSGWLTSHGLLEDVGGLGGIANIVGGVVSAVNIDYYAQQLLELTHHLAINGGNLTASWALRLAHELIESGISEEQLNLDLEDIRERLGWPSYKWNKFLAPVKRKALKVRYKLELKRLLAIENPLELDLEIAEVCQIYRKQRSDVERNLVQFESLTKQSIKGGLFEVQNTLKDKVEPLSYLIPGILPASMSILLSGLSGTGKTELALDLAYALANGEPFMGVRPNKPYKVAILINDQSGYVSKLYLMKKGFLEEETVKCWIKTEADPEGFTIFDMNIIKPQLEEWKPDFIVVDSLRSTVFHPLKISENDANEAGRWTRKLLEGLGQYGATVLVIHHENKSSDSQGVAASSGSGDIPASFDVHWRLQMAGDAKSPKRFWTSAKSRCGNLNAKIEYNPEEDWFELLSWDGQNEADTRQLMSATDKIARLLKLNPQGLFFKDLVEMSGVSDRHVKRCLSQLRSRSVVSIEESITQAGRKRFKYYIDPEAEIFSTPPISLSPDLSKKESITGSVSGKTSGDILGDTGKNDPKIPGDMRGDMRGDPEKNNVVCQAVTEENTTNPEAKEWCDEVIAVVTNPLLSEEEMEAEITVLIESWTKLSQEAKTWIESDSSDDALVSRELLISWLEERNLS
jgi:replicative DNA helicase